MESSLDVTSGSTAKKIEQEKTNKAGVQNENGDSHMVVEDVTVTVTEIVPEFHVSDDNDIDKSVKIYLNMLVGKTITIKSLPSVTIEELKDIIELGRGIVRGKQHIFWRGRELGDNVVISECDAGEEGVLYMNLQCDCDSRSASIVEICVKDGSYLRNHCREGFELV